MKELILMRHAKSSWAEPMQDDYDRTLNERGKTDAPEMGRRLIQKNISPNLIVCSSAKRTHATARLVAEAVKYSESKIIRERGLYEASVYEMLDVIKQLDDNAQTILLIAHNPTITDMVHYLTGNRIGNIPTAGQVHITIKTDAWKQVAQHTGILNWFDYPKNTQRN